MQEKTSRFKEIRESVSGAVELIRQIRAPEMMESFDKILDTSNIVKEIIEGLKAPEMVKNIENFRLISENFNDASTRMQSTIKHLEETGVIDEAVELVKSTRGVVEFVSETGKDFREISGSIKEVFHSIKTAQNKIQKVSEKYQKTDQTPNNIMIIPDEIVIMPDEVEHYLKFGWKYLATLPNGKVVIKKTSQVGNKSEWVWCT
ncbi:MAG: hypothetical protein ABI340_05855 [Nitrososphaera sp.]